MGILAMVVRVSGVRSTECSVLSMCLMLVGGADSVSSVGSYGWLDTGLLCSVCESYPSVARWSMFTRWVVLVMGALELMWVMSLVWFSGASSVPGRRDTGGFSRCKCR